MAKDTTTPVVEEPKVVAVDAPTNETSTPETTVTADSAVKSAPRKKRAKRSVPVGQVHVLATFNNTIISFTDNTGGVLATSSAGACGFRGSKKGTAYAAQVATEKAGQIAKQAYGLSKVDVYIRGIGLGREAAVRTLQTLDIHVDAIKDVTGIAHGGVRPRKARRV